MTQHAPGVEKDRELDEAVARQIEAGAGRVNRPLGALLATGVMGSLEIGIGLLAQYTVVEATGSEILGALAFSVGLIIILMAHSELFTEGFLVPVSAVRAGRASVGMLVRFWVGTLIGNFLGAAIIMWILTTAYPEMGEHLRHEGQYYAGMSPDVQHILLAMLGGMMLTLVTRMHQFADDAVARIIASAIGGFLLAGTGVVHSILDTLFIFGALLVGGSGLTLLDWAGFVWWVCLANLAGGLLLVTSIRFLRSRSHGSA